MIELANVTKLYGTVEAAKDISFSVQRGEIIGLLGVNGAGKTTIMKMITGYHNPHAGTVKVCGYNVMQEPVKVKQCIGYLPETNPLYDDLLVYEYLQFIAHARKISKNDISSSIDRVVQLCSLQQFIYKSISDLSKGMRQRVGLAQALLHDPDVLILDEPTSGLDPNQIKEIRKVIREIGKTKAVMLSTHILQEVEATCDRIMIVSNGKIIAEGTESEIAAKLRGDMTYVLEIVGDITKEVVSEAKSIEGVHTVERMPTKSSEDDTQITTLHVRGDSTALKGEVLFDWARKKKMRLRGLQKSSVNLESIFERLTNTEPATHKETTHV